MPGLRNTILYVAASGRPDTFPDQFPRLQRIAVVARGRPYQHLVISEKDGVANLITSDPFRIGRDVYQDLERAPVEFISASIGMKVALAAFHDTPIAIAYRREHPAIRDHDDAHRICAER